VLARFQDGAATMLFARTGGRWRVARAGGEPLSCPGALPARLQRAWHLTNKAGCPAAVRAPSGPGRPPPARHRSGGNPAAASAAAIVAIALRNVGVGDRPHSTNFGFNCNPYTAMVGAAARSRHCRIDRTYEVLNQNELWCADFAKWVWARGGVSTDLSALTPAASSFYTWGRHQGERMPAGAKTPAPGDAVVFYPRGERPGARYADHVGLVTAVNPDGTVNLVNGDFAGASNITVQASGRVFLASWAAAIWGRGEKWVFVSPLGSQPPAR
jgi:CHAP domain